MDYQVRTVFGTVRLGVRSEKGQLVRGAEDDGPLVRLQGTLEDGTVEVAFCNGSPGVRLTCRVIPNGGTPLIWSTWHLSADQSSARCWIRIPGRQAPGARAMVTDGKTEVWTRII